jgi:hypothetical protein
MFSVSCYKEDDDTAAVDPSVRLDLLLRWLSVADVL